MSVSHPPCFSVRAVPPIVPAVLAGRHRTSVGPLRTRLLAVLDVIGRIGSLVTLVALMVVAGAVGGLFDGLPVAGDAATAGTVQVDGSGR